MKKQKIPYVSFIFIILSGISACSLFQIESKGTGEPIKSNTKAFVTSSVNRQIDVTEASSNPIETATPQRMSPTIAQDNLAQLSRMSEVQVEKVNTLAWASDNFSFGISGRINGRFGIATFTAGSGKINWFYEAGPIFGFAFTNDGKYLAFSPSTGHMIFLDTTTGKKVKDFTVNTCAGGDYIVVVTKDNYLYAASTSGGKNTPFITSIDRWNTINGSCQSGIIQQNGLLISMESGFRSNLLINMSIKESKGLSEAQVWDLSNNNQTCRINGKLAVFQGKSENIVILTNEGTDLWDTAKCKKIKTLKDISLPGRIAIHPNGNLLVTNERDITFWDLTNGNNLIKLDNLPNPPMWPSIILFNPLGNLFLSVIPKNNENNADVVVTWHINK